jgi:hypothetical protein
MAESKPETVEEVSTENETSLSDSQLSEQVLTNLKILAQVKPNDKLTQDGNLLVIDTPYWGQGTLRWWKADSRVESLNFIEKIVNNTFKLIENIYSVEFKGNNKDIENNYYYKHSLPKDYFKSENSQQLLNFSTELTNTIKGLENLKLTYHKDISVCSKIDVVIEKINIRIRKISSLLTVNTGTSK